MKIFILAAGTAERWEGKIKQLCPVRDGTVLSRTMKMLEGRDCTILTHRQEIMDQFPKKCVIPKNHNKLLDTVVSSKHLWDMTNVTGEICFLMGDVIFTKKALDRILEPINKSHQFYGSFDEHFAFRFNEVTYKRVQRGCRSICNSSKFGTTWELYRLLTEIPLDKNWTDTWFRTLILDKTDDIDYPADYEAKISSGYFEDKEFDL